MRPTFTSATLFLWRVTETLVDVSNVTCIESKADSGSGSDVLSMLSDRVDGL